MSFSLKSNALIKSFFIYGITSGLSRFISLLLIPIYVRVFSTAEYGIIDMLQTIVYIVLIFGLLQLETSIQRYYYEVSEKERKRMISSVMLSVFVISTFLAFLISIFSSPLSQWLFKTSAYSSDIIITALIIPLMNISILNFIVLRFDKKSFVFSIATFVQVLCTTALTILFAIVLKWGIKSVFLGQLGGFLIVIVIQSFYVKKQLTWCFDISLMRKMLKFSLPQFPARIGSESNNRINRFIILAHLSTSALGIYAVAVRFSSAMELINVAFIMSWIPYMYESVKKDNYKKKFSQIYQAVVGLGFLAIVILSLFSTEIIILFTIPEYYDAKYLLPGLFLFNGLYLIKSVVEIGAALSKKTIYITYTYIFVAAINILLLIIGIKFMGMKGVVYALVLTNFCLVLLSWCFTEKLYPIGYNIKIFIISFFLTAAIILVLMNFDLSLLLRGSTAFMLVIVALIYVIKQKSEWRKLIS